MVILWYYEVYYGISFSTTYSFIVSKQDTLFYTSEHLRGKCLEINTKTCTVSMVQAELVQIIEVILYNYLAYSVSFELKI